MEAVSEIEPRHTKPSAVVWKPNLCLLPVFGNWAMAKVEAKITKAITSPCRLLPTLSIAFPINFLAIPMTNSLAKTLAIFPTAFKNFLSFFGFISSIILYLLQRQYNYCHHNAY